MIRFDELTHFTEYMYLYLYSRLRGSNGYPKQLKSSTNPGGPGHYFVKKRFIDPAPPGEEFATKLGTRRFIPAAVQDNLFLSAADPMYGQRLKNLPISEQKRLLYGEWELADGRYFTEWDPAVHIVPAFSPPPEWPVYVSIDYGLDMLAVCCFADAGDRIYLFREVYESGLIISEAARRVRAAADNPEAVYAPADMWNRRQDSGRSAADIFFENGVALTRVSGSRVDGWLAVKELLKPVSGQNKVTSALAVTAACPNVIRCMGAIGCSALDPNDAAVQPHELTHAPDALRYFASQRRRGRSTVTQDGQLSSLLSFGI